LINRNILQATVLDSHRFSAVGNQVQNLWGESDFFFNATLFEII